MHASPANKWFVAIFFECFTKIFALAMASYKYANFSCIIFAL